MKFLFVCILATIVIALSYRSSKVNNVLRVPARSCTTELKCLPKEIPKPTVITPENRRLDMEKFLMMYTCKMCNGRNAQMISKVAYYNGMVVSRCAHCRQHHLIADNEGKLDMKEYGKKIEDYLAEKGEKVQKLSLTPEDLENNYILDEDGQIILIPKIAGQPPVNATIVEFPKAP